MSGWEAGAVDSDVVAFERAYDAYSRAVFAAAFAILGDAARAQDVVQDVFLTLWNRPESYDPGRGSLGRYLKLVARSRALDLWREAQVAGRATERLRLITGRDEGRVDDRPSLATERRTAQAIVRQALMRLPRSQREPIVMAYWGGLTADQISERSSVPLGTVKSRIRLGLLRLRAECAAELDPLPVAA